MLKFLLQLLQLLPAQIDIDVISKVNRSSKGVCQIYSYSKGQIYSYSKG